MLLCSGSRSVLWNPRRAATTAWIVTTTRTRGRRVRSNAARLRGGPAVHGHGGRGCGRPLAPPERAYRRLEGADAPRSGALTTPCSSHDRQEETDPPNRAIMAIMAISRLLGKRARVWSLNGMLCQMRSGEEEGGVGPIQVSFLTTGSGSVRIVVCALIAATTSFDVFGERCDAIYHVTRVRETRRRVCRSGRNISRRKKEK